MDDPRFEWPAGKRMALSLTFDDARGSQVDRGAPLLAELGVHVTFYVSPDSIERRPAEWRRMAGMGHEIGNHTQTHPCSRNFSFARGNGLEDYTLERMADELRQADESIERLLGIRPTTFAYPCGQKFVGRGEGVMSYVPLVAKRFLAGRGFNDERHNDPRYCDLAQIYGVDMDCKSFGELEPHIEAPQTEQGWLVLVGHEIGDSGRQVTRESTLHDLCRHALDPRHGIWLTTVANVANYIKQQTHP